MAGVDSCPEMTSQRTTLPKLVESGCRPVISIENLLVSVCTGWSAGLWQIGFMTTVKRRLTGMGFSVQTGWWYYITLQYWWYPKQNLAETKSPIFSSLTKLRWYYLPFKLLTENPVFGIRHNVMCDFCGLELIHLPQVLQKIIIIVWKSGVYYNNVMLDNMVWWGRRLTAGHLVEF